MAETKREQERMKVLATLGDEELYQRFWDLTDQLVAPLLEMAGSHTTPSIERSILLRMGFNSLQANAFIDRCIQAGVIGHGAGALLLTYARQQNIDYQQAFHELMEMDSWPEIHHAN
jgi:D-ornithine 4,5-aminomutase subunit alpha